MGRVFGLSWGRFRPNPKTLNPKPSHKLDEEAEAVLGRAAAEFVSMPMLQSGALTCRKMEVSENWGTLFWGPYNKDPTI